VLVFTASPEKSGQWITSCCPAVLFKSTGSVVLPLPTVAVLPDLIWSVGWLNYENFVVAYCFAGVVTVAAFLIRWLIVGW